MNQDTAAHIQPTDQASEAERLPYTAPLIVEIGTIGAITFGATGVGADAGVFFP